MRIGEITAEKRARNVSIVGLLLQAEVIGAERLIYIKDVDGVYTDDPQKNPDAEFISAITARELLNGDYPDLPIERELLRTLDDSRSITAVRVINGLNTDNLRRALNGEDVGTIIYSRRHPGRAGQAR